MQVGERIKALRIGRQMTVGALAERTGLSKGLISQIENDKTSPSLATLEKIAQGLDVPAAYLLLQPNEGIQVIRASERPEYHFGADKIKVEILSGRSARSLKAVLVEFPPGTSTGCDSHAHSGEEFHVVLDGQIQAIQGEHAVTLGPGDAFHWKGCIPHRVVNVGPDVARVLAVSSTTMLQMLGQESDLE